MRSSRHPVHPAPQLARRASRRRRRRVSARRAARSATGEPTNLQTGPRRRAARRRRSRAPERAGSDARERGAQATTQRRWPGPAGWRPSARRSRAPERAGSDARERGAQATTQRSAVSRRGKRQTARGGGIGPSVSGVGKRPVTSAPNWVSVVGRARVGPVSGHGRPRTHPHGSQGADVHCRCVTAKKNGSRTPSWSGATITMPVIGLQRTKTTPREACTRV